MRRLAWLGVLNPGVSYALGLAGLAHITASLSVLLWATEPLLILALAGWLLREQITKPLAAASIVGVVGVAFATLETETSGEWGGVALTLAGVAACAVYTVMTKKLMVRDSTLAVVTVQQTAALVFALLLLGGAVLLQIAPAWPRASAAAWASAIVSGLLYYAVAFWLYITGLRRIPAAIAGVFINLVPFFGVIGGYLLLSERLSGRQWIGALLIVGAVAALSVPSTAGQPSKRSSRKR